MHITNKNAFKIIFSRIPIVSISLEIVVSCDSICIHAFEQAIYVKLMHIGGTRKDEEKNPEM